MNFEVPPELKKDVEEALKGINSIKDKYKGIAKFGNNNQKLI